MTTTGSFPDERGPTRYEEHAFYWGKVSDNLDPERRGRIKAHVPGLFDGTDWIAPIGWPGGGSPDVGSYYPPRVGALVLVGFVLGDYDEPFYLQGPPILDSSTRAPRKIQQQAVAEAANTRVLAQTESFEVYICDNENEKRLVLQGLNDDTETISINLLDGSIRLTATTTIIMEAPRISIKATGQLSLNDRPVGHIGTLI